jgi:hypothetical protein
VENLDLLSVSECHVKLEEQLELLQSIFPLSLPVPGWPLSISSFLLHDWIHGFKYFHIFCCTLFFSQKFFSLCSEQSCCLVGFGS